MENKTVLISRTAVHYRKNIFTLLNNKLNVDFYFGDYRPGDIKKLDYNLLSNFKKECKNIVLIKEPLYWQKGIMSLAFKPYKNYILTGGAWSISNKILIVLCRLLGKKVYIWEHGWYGSESKLRSCIKILTSRIINGHFLYGEYAKNLMINKGINEKKLHVIYNSLDYDKHIGLRSTISKSEIFENHFINKNKNLIFIGRLTPIKRLDLLIKAIAVLNQKGLPLNLTIIGEGKVKNELIELAVEKNISNNLWFYGECFDESKIAELIYNSDLCVSPGNVGLTAMHMMSFGTPVITHNNFPKQMPEFEAITEGITGAFFEYNDLESLEKTIRDWINNSKDRNIIRQKCYDVIDSKFNPYFQLEKFQTILK